MYCSKCGTKCETGKFCQHCGAPLDEPIVTHYQTSPVAQAKNKWLIIAIPAVAIALIIMFAVFNSPSHKIIGTWYAIDEEGVWMSFTKDGTCSMSDEDGTSQYRIEGNNTLVLMVSDWWSGDSYDDVYNFKFEDGGLTLYQNGYEYHFRKAN